MLLRVAVDAAPWLVDDPFVPEVGSQGVVICGKGASAGDNGQSENMMIIGRAAPGGVQTSLLQAKLFRVFGSQPSSLFQSHKPPSHICIPGELLKELAGGHQFWIPAFPKKPSDDGARLREVCRGDVCIHDEAHVRYPKDRVLRSERIGGSRAADW